MLIWDKYVKINNIPYLYPVGISGWKIYPHNIVHRLGQTLWLVICSFLLSWRAIYVLALCTGSNWVHTNWTATLHPKYSLQVILLLWVKIFEVEAEIEFGISSLLHFIYSFRYNFDYFIHESMRWPKPTTVVEAIAGKYKSKSCFPFQKRNVQRKIPDLASLATGH